VKRHAGSLEASRLPFWPEARFRSPKSAPLEELMGVSSSTSVTGRTISAAARARIAAALQALRR